MDKADDRPDEPNSTPDARAATASGAEGSGPDTAAGSLLQGAEPDPDRLYSKRLFKYILSEYLRITAACLIGFLALFTIIALGDDLEDFIKYKASAGLTVRYFLMLLPAQSVLVIPMSLLLAAMYTVSRLCRDHELTALTASGSSLLSVCLPIWSVAAAAAVALFCINEYVAPGSLKSAVAIIDNLSDPYSARAEKPDNHLAVRMKDTRRDWLFENFDSAELSTGVIVTQFRQDSGAEWELHAGSAAFRNGAWVFNDEQVTWFDDNGQPLPPAEAEQKSLPKLTEDPSRFDFVLRLKPSDTMSVLEIAAVLRHPDANLTAQTRAILKTQLYARLFFPLSCIVAVLLGVPMAVTTERASVMKSVILAAVLMGAYYLATQTFVVFGKMNVLWPFIANALPNIGFLAWGGFELRRKM
jgi:lipopolysaccharide export system permease protein